MTGTNQPQDLEATIAQLHQHMNVLQDDIVAVLKRHSLDNVDQLAARQNLPSVAERIITIALDYLAGYTNNADLFVHLTELVEMGLRNESVLSITDAVMSGCQRVLAEDKNGLAAVSSKLSAYRHGFVQRYMDAIVEYVMREREAVYATMGTAIDAQVQIEQQLRHSLEAQQKQLARYTAELESVAEISRAIATILDVDTLLATVVDLTKQRFDLYHTHIYLMDSVGKQLKLVAGSSDVGHAMVDEGRVINLEQTSLVARAARQKQAVIANNVQTDPDFLPHPLLPDTHAEMAVPLLVGDTVLGVLDLQAERTDYFTEDDRRIQTTLAAQIAVALQNADSFARSEAARQELDMLTRRLTREGWQEFTETAVSQDLRFAYDLQQVFSPENGQAAAKAPALKQPLVVQGTEIGQLWLDEPQALTEDAADIVTAVAERLAMHIENLRLTSQTQRALADTEQQAKRLEMLNAFGAELSAAQSTEDLYRATARYTSAIIDANQVSLALLQSSDQSIVLFKLDRQKGAVPLQTRQSLTETAVGAAILNNRLINIPNLSQSQFADNSEALGPNAQSLMTIPLAPSNKTLGTLSVSSQQANAFTYQDETLLRQIGSLLAATIERQNLFEQMQRALGETATLYDISARLNAAASPADIVTTIAEVSQADNLALMTFTLDQNNFPYSMEVSAVWPEVAADPDVVVPEFKVANYPTSHIWLNSPNAPIFITDRDTDEQLDEASRIMLTNFGIRSTVWMPLYQNKRWIGMLTLNWPEPRQFSDRMRRVLQSLMDQTTIAVSQWQLLQQTQARATQLEELTDLENDLSQSRNLADLLAVALAVSSSPMRATLYYIDADQQGQPLTARLVAQRIGVDGKVKTAVSAPEQPITSLPQIDVWSQNPNQVYSSSPNTEKPLVVLPLQTAGRWQGAMLLEWDQPHDLSEREHFLLRQLLEPISAVFASQRALAETEALYQASAKINTVQDYGQILDVLREYTIVGQQPNLVSLNLFNRPWTEQQQPETVNVLTYWSDEPLANELLTYSLSDYPSAPDLLKPDQATVITNVKSDPRPDKSLRLLFQRVFGATSVLLVPLVSGGRWRGYISAFYGQQMDFPEADIRRLTSLASQAAVAIQSLQLLRQTEQQLANLTNIQETTSSLSAALSYNDAASTFLQQVCQAVGADSVDMYELHGEVVSRIAIYPMQPDKPVAFSCTLEKQTMMRWAVAERRPKTLSINDKSLDESLRRSFADAGIQTNVTLPLIGRSGIYGILSVNRTSDLRQFDEQELNLLQTLSDQAMIAFERVQLLEETTRRAEQEQRLREVTTRVRGSIDVDTIMRTAVQEVGRVLGRRTMIYLDQESENGETQNE
jgi:GAF domain-containing protein